MKLTMGLKRTGLHFVPLQLLASCLISASASVPQKTSVEILEGNNLLVFCNATELDDTEVFWSKNDSSSLFHQEGKRLAIPNITRFDSGEYICYGRNTSFPFPGHNFTVEETDVDVQYPAEVNAFSINKDELLENDTFSVSCDIEGNPGPSWAVLNKDTGWVLVTGTGKSNFTLSDIVARCDRDSGVWECTGGNELNKGIKASKGVNLTVYCPPRPLMDQNTYLVQTVLRESASLVMNLVARPQATFSWVKDDGTDISKFSTQTGGFNRTTLTFQNVSIEAFGKYTLRMENKYGTYFAQFSLEADGPPETPTDLSYSGLTYNTVKLHWKSGFDMGSRQHFLVMKRINGSQYIQMSDRIDDLSPNHGVNQTWTYVVRSLVSETYYNLSVLAINDRGYNSKLAYPAVGFWTKKFSDNLRNGSDHVTLIVGLVLGTVGTVGMILLILYVYRYRTQRAQYTKY